MALSVEDQEAVGGDTKTDAADRLRAGGMTDEGIKSRMASFSIFDKNKDGVVDLKELKEGLFEKFGTTASDEEIKSAIASFDTNNNGVLEADEFVVGQIKRLIETRQDEISNTAAEGKRKEMESKRLEEAGASSAPSVEIVLNSDTGFGTRAASCVPYILPLVDATNYGYHLLSQAPIAATALFPFVALFRLIPFGGFLAFLFLSQQSRNPSNPALLRFNLQQAVILDIALFIPQLLISLLSLNQEFLTAAEPISDAVFLISVGAIVYCWVTNLATGRYPNKLPIISDAAERTTGPQEDE
eukprot:CAMPEP_0171606348 /NCGR_PEP_ID=MMETSP0990-20121206/7714_1 /TAXON_ID=483369 /ORGANISM="non described non described, Strain CCMP2098" /LENGTH=299 /DNA_ID=CAMNT_0012169177 /DNA_START=302 /DNA_END=1201 /DNA_ORIENTATION=+